MRIGIPRGLLYYRFFPLWKTFFENLGEEIVLSDETSRSLIEKGIKLAVPDACLPLKIYLGHVNALKECADYLFIPRIVSIEKDCYMCPKLIGLPDVVKASFDSLPPLIDPTINVKKDDDSVLQGFIMAGRFLNKRYDLMIDSFSRACTQQELFLNKLKDGALLPELLSQEPIPFRHQNGIRMRYDGKKMRIGIIGRPYMVYDAIATKDIFSRFVSMGFEIITPEKIKKACIEESMEKLIKKVYWSFGKEEIGATLSIIKDKSVDGILGIFSFGCGQDSFMEELIKRYSHRLSTIPYISLLIDEHTTTAAIETRIEAFLDMLARRNTS